jgi:hypothetical protein
MKKDFRRGGGGGGEGGGRNILCVLNKQCITAVLTAQLIMRSGYFRNSVVFL